MAEVVSRTIENDEILVRLIFEGDFKKNNVHQDNIIEKSVFVDTRNNEVSLQRERYSDESNCKRIGKLHPHRFVGFVVFKKKSFDDKVIEHVKLRNDFKADVFATPLDEHNKVISDSIEVTTETPILPAHADLVYINPAAFPTDDSPHTSVRLFSKNLLKESVLILDPDLDSDDFEEIKFQEALA